MPTKEQDTFVIGGILAVLGLYVIVSSHDLLSGFFLLGLGVVFMASSSKEFREQVFDSFFLYLQRLMEIAFTV